jgi:small subunit ribosomal protein S1
VHISELAQHHVENPREVVSQGQPVNVKIIEVDGERRRLSLSLKRVEDTDPVQPRADGAESVHTRPAIDLSEDVFADEAPPLELVEAPEPEAGEATEAEEEAEAESTEEEAPDELPAAEAEDAPADEAAQVASAEAAETTDAVETTAAVEPGGEPEASSPEE